MSEPIILDQGVRDEALNPARSFVVQAPAGSGKTGLLIQRYLALLCVAEKPEEILAITFTRKAAAEMRERIVSILSYTADDSIADDENLNTYDQKILELAWQAQAQNSAKEWGILENPNRMQIMTIDAFCARIVSAMPVGSRFGGMPNLVDDASVLYQSAINNYFRDFLRGSNTEQSLETVLLQLNNDFDRVASLLKTLLGRRDQWLPYVTNAGLIEVGQLNDALGAAIHQDLMPLTHLLQDELSTEISAMASYAAESLRAAYRESEINDCQYITEFPNADIESIAIWRGLRKLLLTDKGKLRSRVTIAEGFPAESSTDDADLRLRYKQFKERMSVVLKRLAKEDKFIGHLNLVADIPPSMYSASDQNFLTALFSVLKHVTAELLVEFQRTGVVDFIELTQSALRALGDSESPTDLSLSFDTRINHILIDEFQDTSRVHLDLLNKLTLGWQESGRSLFVVGDPMQSIYRFRDADIRNFMQIKQRGVNAVRPTFLQLESNFRSSKKIVDFNNRAFTEIFPDTDDMNQGHVAYHKAQAIKPPEKIVPVTLHTVGEHQHKIEAQAVVELILELQKNDPQSTIGVLVRSRSQLSRILPSLRLNGIVSGLDGMEKLAERQEVLDVYSLCMAVVHPADRKSWLSVLRAPWCGLDLAELELLANFDNSNLILESLQSKDFLIVLSKESQDRIAYLVNAFETAQSMLYRESLAVVVEGLWLRLNGPSCLESDEQYANVEKFFKLLRNESVNTVLGSENRLSDRLNEFTGKSDQSNNENIQVLTIHMAKGLEFDHVILPGAGRKTRGNDSELLVWQELTGGDGRRHLMLSHYQTDGDTPIYKYIRKRNQRLQDAELTRLLYVALTRCVKSMHMFCATRTHDDEQKIVAQAGSFMRLLQPALHLIDEQVDHSVDDKQNETAELLFYRKRIKSIIPADLGVDVKIGDLDRSLIAPEFIEYEWASETAMHVGTVVHLALKQLGSGTLDQWLQIDDKDKRPHFSRVLKALGIPGTELEMAVDRTLLAIKEATQDKKGRWLLSSSHTEVGNEYLISGFIQGEFRNYRIDRTFVSDDVRWIIDYKTSSHMGGNLDTFLDNEVERYNQQLENYALLMSQIDKRPIKLGLYFPLVQGWREWDYVPG